MEIVMMKTHLIVTDKWDDFYVEQYPTFPRLKDLNVKLFDGKPCFVITTKNGAHGRIEIPTFDYNYIIKQAIKDTMPRGRSAITKDEAYIWVKTADKGEVQIAKIRHVYNKKFAPMYDPVAVY